MAPVPSVCVRVPHSPSPSFDIGLCTTPTKKQPFDSDCTALAVRECATRLHASAFYLTDKSSFVLNCFPPFHIHNAFSISLHCTFYFHLFYIAFEHIYLDTFIIIIIQRRPHVRVSA